MTFLLLPETLFVAIGVVASDHFYYGTLVSWFVYRIIYLAQYSNRSRFNVRESFTPGNIFQFIWYLLCVILPIYISVFSPSFAPLKMLPSSFSINKSIVLTAVSYLSASIGISFYSSLRNKRILKSLKSINEFDENDLRKYLITTLTFGTIGVILLGLNSHISSGISIAYSTYLAGSSSWSKFLSIILPPFIIYSVVVLSALRIHQNRYKFFSNFLLLIFATLPMTLFRLNRAAIFLPVFCYLAIFLQIKSKAKYFLTWLLISLIGGLAVFSVAEYRAQQIVTKGGQISAASIGYQHNQSVLNSIQNYLNAPQYLGYALQEIPPNSISVISPLKSIAAPLPKLSKFNSDRNDGTSIYNLSISNSRSFDQVLSPIIESWLSLGLLGLFITFFMQGIVISIIKKRYAESHDFIKKYFLLYSAIWVSLFPCVSYVVLSQITFFVLLPPLILFRFLSTGKIAKVSSTNTMKNIGYSL